MSDTAWTWNTATPRERSNWVRAHQYNVKTVSQLCRLFSLTEDGATKILNGDVWRPEYDAARPAPAAEGG